MSSVQELVEQELLLGRQRRNYGEYWSASSAGYCNRRLIFDRLQVPYTHEPDQGVFLLGHIYHAWLQQLTRQAGVTVGQEEELVDEDLHVKGHFDDLVFIDDHLVLYDYKTARGNALEYPLSFFHRMQVGTYLHMLNATVNEAWVNEARILKIAKDDLPQQMPRMHEQKVRWTKALSRDIVDFWTTLDKNWRAYEVTGYLPDCTCDLHENGFLAREAFNPYWYEGEPCSGAWFEKHRKEAENVTV